MATKKKDFRKNIVEILLKEEEDAAKAYNKAAVKLFGEYARLNEIEK